MKKKRQINPSSLANLKPAKLGEVRNPKGLNGRQTPFTELYAQLIEEELTREAFTATVRQMLRSPKFAMMAAKEMADRIQGKAAIVEADKGERETHVYLVVGDDEQKKEIPLRQKTHTVIGNVEIT